MSTLWTPDGERPVNRSQPDSPAAAQPGPLGSAPDAAEGEPTEEEMRAQMAEMQEELAKTPAEVIIANHAFGLFELAALHLSLRPPQLEQSRAAIDACGALVEGMAGRLGQAEAQLVEGLGQLRMAFVQISAAAAAETPGDSPGPASSGSDA